MNEKKSGFPAETMNDKTIKNYNTPDEKDIQRESNEKGNVSFEDSAVYKDAGHKKVKRRIADKYEKQGYQYLGYYEKTLCFLNEKPFQSGGGAYVLRSEMNELERVGFSFNDDFLKRLIK